VGEGTKIQWTDATWNPVRGCSVVSEGCRHCYAMGVAARFSKPGEPYAGLARFSAKRKLPQWTGKVATVPEHFADPLRWVRPRRVFVNSMSDLFHEELPFPVIAGLLGIMGAATAHTFQVLTKRPVRALEFHRWLASHGQGHAATVARAAWYAERLLADAHDVGRGAAARARCMVATWPFPNVWIGVSVEDQDSADNRIHPLLEIPAAIRFVSYEPALGPVEWHPSWFGAVPDGRGGWSTVERSEAKVWGRRPTVPGIDWLIAGGESGRDARACDVAWLRAARDAASAYGAACFIKQLGADPYTHDVADAAALLALRDPKGGNPAEWPADLDVREWP
jgi:protein gp37